MASETYAGKTVAPPARRAAGNSTAENAVVRQRESAIWSDPEQGSSTDRAPRPGSRKEPRLRQLMGVCGWATVLGGVGLVLGIRGLVGILGKHAPTWFEPAMSVTGIVGIALTVGGFLTVHRRRAPWIFLTAASLVLVVAMLLTSKAF